MSVLDDLPILSYNSLPLQQAVLPLITFDGSSGATVTASSTCGDPPSNYQPPNSFVLLSCNNSNPSHSYPATNLLYSTPADDRVRIQSLPSLSQSRSLITDIRGVSTLHNVIFTDTKCSPYRGKRRLRSYLHTLAVLCLSY